jgi:thiamine biosynthesis lipoprotein
MDETAAIIEPVNRRRFIGIAAAAAGLGLMRGARAEPAVHYWHGAALGADACITLHHPDEAAARRLIAAALAEVRRLEGVFSLYRADSALTTLNRHGVLDAPPPELVRLLAESRRFGDITDGGFDVTVQPLWDLYAGHFAGAAPDPTGPPGAALERARALIDYRALTVGAERVALARPDMAVTLNGIAQGFITDAVAELLRDAGLESVLVELGETRAVGRHPTGRPWRVGLADPADRDVIVQEIAVTGRAVATSAGAATRFEPSGRHHHLFDPRTGRSAQTARAVTVVAPRATTADALSTAFAVLPAAAIEPCLSRAGGGIALVTGHDGTVATYRVG